MIRIFIGFDRRETVASTVLTHSIVSRSSRPLAVTPIVLDQLKGVFRRQRHPLQSSDFSFSRFLVPHLCDFDGWAIFMDCDMLVQDDIARLWDLKDDRFAVQVVKHAHVPSETTKFLGEPQSRYEKKNWSSVMLFNCRRCTALTPAYVNTASGLELHRFQWLGDDGLIGALPQRWNHLVDYDPPLAAAEISNFHYTVGGPYFADYAGCGYADLWFAERERMLFALQKKK